MNSDWFALLQSAEKIAVIESGSRKIHYKFNDGREMVEEYSLVTGVLTKRAWKKNNILKSSKWEVEVGEFSRASEEDGIGITESRDAPFVAHRVTKKNYEWRIRNFRYSDESEFEVLLDQHEKCVVIRTFDKKFYKRMPILDLIRLNQPTKTTSLSHSRSLNTLVIQYAKPSKVIDFEKRLAEELENVRVVDDADMNCRPS